MSCFGDARSLTIADPDHSLDEERQVLIGRSAVGRMLVVSFTERGDTLRIISARKASWTEQRDHDQA